MWFGAAYPITARAFQLAIANHAVSVGGGVIRGATLLGRNSLSEFGRIMGRLGAMMFDPFICAVCGGGAPLPLAHIFSVSDRKLADAEPLNMVYPGHPAVFAFQ